MEIHGDGRLEPAAHGALDGGAVAAAPAEQAPHAAGSEGEEHLGAAAEQSFDAAPATRPPRVARSSVQLAEPER